MFIHTKFCLADKVVPKDLTVTRYGIGTVHKIAIETTLNYYTATYTVETSFGMIDYSEEELQLEPDYEKRKRKEMIIDFLRSAR